MPLSPALAPERSAHPGWQLEELFASERWLVAGDARNRPGTTIDARTALYEAASAAAEAAARALSLAQLLEEVLAELPEAEVAVVRTDPQVADPCGPDWLSPREREVLALVTAGRTNKAIASALYVSPNTVKTHVTSLLHKLRADSRVQLATIATRHCPHAATGASSDPVLRAASRS
jgi:DNA-binding NarL/FixJ family response regulator